MAKSTDVRVTSATLYFLPVTTRVPLKFGTETLTSVTCALRVRSSNTTRVGVTNKLPAACALLDRLATNKSVIGTIKIKPAINR